MPTIVRIDVELARRKMSVGEFADRVDVTPHHDGADHEGADQAGARLGNRA